MIIRSNAAQFHRAVGYCQEPRRETRGKTHDIPTCAAKRPDLFLTKSMHSNTERGICQKSL